MQIPPNIRQFYTPIQPTVKQSAENVTYAEFLPDLQLQPFIYCYWQLKTDEKLSEEYFYNVVTDGCIDIFFELDNFTDSYVMGFCKKYVEFPLGKSFNYIGIRFLPTMFSQLFKVNAKELSNQFQNLQSIVPNTANFLLENINSNLSINEIIKVFDVHFIEQVSNSTFDFDNRLYDALQIILKNFGVVDIEKDLNTGISDRQLRRLFEYYIGTNAKTFSQVVRFQNILKAKPSSQSLRHNKLFFDVGYYDQAHFIKEFKKLYGVTPSKAFRR